MDNSNPSQDHAREALLRGGFTGSALRVKVIGVGGAGNNAVGRLQSHQMEAVELAAVNTDAQALSSSPLAEKCLIGRQLTRGLSAGGEMAIGQKAAEADVEALTELVREVDLVFLIAGLGGGTGSGAAPVLAQYAEREGALVIAFVSMPFTWEGVRRHEQADAALAALREHCSAVIPLPNDMLLQELKEDATVLDAFLRADEWIRNGIYAITTMLFKTGMINLDFSSLREALHHRGGRTLFGLGSGYGTSCMRDALDSLQRCPLLHTPEISSRADSLLVSIVGGADLSLAKVNEILVWVADAFGSRDNTVMGAVIDESLQQTVELCVIGSTSIHARAKGDPRGASPIMPKTEVALLHTEPASDVTQRPVHQSKLKKKEMKNGLDQDEFTFVKMEEQRGFFDRTERNMFDGEDLDVPTFLRKGIKITR